MKNTGALDRLLDILGVADESYMPPVSPEERGFLKLQLLCAQVLAQDVNEITDPDIPDVSRRSEILDGLLENLKSCIKAATNEILDDPSLQINVIRELKKVNKL